MSETFDPDATYANLDYTSSFVTGEPTEIVTMFYPSGDPADYGWADDTWPCLAIIENSGFNTGSIPTSITGPLKLAWHFLVRGVAVAHATTVQVENEGSGGPNGAGVFRPPGEVAANYDQWSDGTFPCTHKSGVHLIQYLKDQAATLSIKADTICMAGRSGGAMAPLWCGLGTDWSTYTGGSGQFRASISSRPAAIIPMQFHSWIDAFVSSQQFRVFPSSSSPTTNYANTLAQVTGSPHLTKESSAMYFGFDETKYPGIQALNAAMPCYLYSTDDLGSEDFTLDGNDLPTLSATLTDDHDGWFIAMLWKRLLSLSTSFHARRSRCTFAAGKEPDGSVVPYVRSFAETKDVYADMAEWFLGIAAAQPTDEPLSEKVLAQVASTLRNVTAGTSYFHTIRDVTRDDRAFAQGTKFPTAVVLPTRTDMDGRYETATASIRHEMRCAVGLAIKDRSDAVRDMERLIRDVTKALYTDHTRANLAANTVVEGVTRTYPDGDQSGVYVAWLDVVIHFRSEESDLSAPV